MQLPPTQDDSPTYRKYVEFTNMMKEKQFHRVADFLKQKRPDLAICTYTSAGVDVIRKESNSALGLGTYHDTDKAKWTLLTCGPRQLANAAVHFFAIGYRHAAVSPYLTGQVPDGLTCLGPVDFKQTHRWNQGSYVRIRPQDKQRLDQPILTKLDLVFLRGQFHVYETGQGVDGLLRLIPPDMFGPPEKCYYRHVSDHPALLHHAHGSGAAACLTFDIGTHYYRQGHQGHAALLMGTIDHLLQCKRRVQVEAPPLVEITHRADRNGRFEWISLYNHSGQRGDALHVPVPISSIQIRFIPSQPVRAVRLLKARRELAFDAQGDRVTVQLPPLDQYEIVVLEYESPAER